MRVLGIDPGSIRTGFSVLESSEKQHFYIASGTIFLDEKLSLAQKLLQLSHDLRKILNNYRPTDLALENIFFAKNAQSALKLGHARGVVLMQAAGMGLKIFEYSPTEVKHSLCGRGRADKDEVAQMAKFLLRFPKTFNFKTPDESDAVAIGLAHLQTKRLKLFQKASSSKDSTHDRATFWQTEL